MDLFGCDLDRQALRERKHPGYVCNANLHELPYPSETFALVTSNMVVEHLEFPGQCIAELARVTAVGGRIVIHTVNQWHYLSLAARITPNWFHEWVVERLEGRAAADVYPTHYRANSVAKLTALFEACGCRWSRGGLLPALPLFIPYPGLFELALALGLLERNLSTLFPLQQVFSSNILIEFEKCQVRTT
jgi:SAM-dependent methyltransferase